VHEDPIHIYQVIFNSVHVYSSVVYCISSIDLLF
jgi:hypothetical protein